MADRERRRRAGACLHLIALSGAPLTIIQPIGVTGLLFAIVLSAAFNRQRVRVSQILADRLLTVLGPPRIREQLGRASREIALEHDHHRSLERFEAVYTRVRGRGTVRPAVERVMVA